MACLICGSTVSTYCTAQVLGKYRANYLRCNHCKFIFAEKPFWLEEAYNSAITKLDIGLTARNEFMAPMVASIIRKWFDVDAKFIDYGGGYGMLVRMMRDRGYNFFRQDLYCENLYAEHFDVTDEPTFKAELLTAFEVFEHLVDPVSELEKMLALSDNILFSTEIQPSKDVTPDSWWYFTPETGQHIALYSRESLQALANKFGLHYCWSEQNIHFFSRKALNHNLFKIMTNPRYSAWYNKLKGQRRSLLEQDFLYVRSLLKTELDN